MPFGRSGGGDGRVGGCTIDAFKRPGTGQPIADRLVVVLQRGAVVLTARPVMARSEGLGNGGTDRTNVAASRRYPDITDLDRSAEYGAPAEPGVLINYSRNRLCRLPACDLRRMICDVGAPCDVRRAGLNLVGGERCLASARRRSRKRALAVPISFSRQAVGERSAKLISYTSIDRPAMGRTAYLSRSSTW
jgi:hypothetical protein